MSRSVLVVGAGIAGSTLAFLLGRSGVDVMVVERSGGLRTSGSPVDVRGPALPVIERMGLLAAVRAAATRASRLAAVDDEGEAIGWIPTQVGRGVEIPRSALADILVTAGKDCADFRFDESVTVIRNRGGGVEVEFERAAPRRFDLVVGADGLHSTVRRLVFGPQEQFVTHLGLYIATTMLNRTSADPRTVLIHNRPGRAIVVHPTTGREGVAFLFRHPPLPVDLARDPWEQRRLIATTYAGMGWRTGELLDAVRDSSDMYFDAVSRVRLDRWSASRVVLVGDAADCVSLFGEGSSLAVAGAATLADHLAGCGDDPTEALRRYERVHRRRLRAHHLGAPMAGHLLVPSSVAGIVARDTAFRVCAGAATVGHRIRRASAR